MVNKNSVAIDLLSFKLLLPTLVIAILREQTTENNQPIHETTLLFQLLLPVPFCQFHLTLQDALLGTPWLLRDLDRF